MVTWGGAHESRRAVPVHVTAMGGALGAQAAHLTGRERRGRALLRDRTSSLFDAPAGRGQHRGERLSTLPLPVQQVRARVAEQVVHSTQHEARVGGAAEGQALQQAVQAHGGHQQQLQGGGCVVTVGPSKDLCVQ